MRKVTKELETATYEFHIKEGSKITTRTMKLPVKCELFIREKLGAFFYRRMSLIEREKIELPIGQFYNLKDADLNEPFVFRGLNLYEHTVQKYDPDKLEFYEETIITSNRNPGRDFKVIDTQKVVVEKKASLYDFYLLARKENECEEYNSKNPGV